MQRRSWLSIQFLGVPNRALYWIGLAVWALSAVVVIAHPRVEDLLARSVYRLRPPSTLASQRLGPAWWAVCTAAGVDPNRYRVWIHEGPEATAPATAGTTVSVTSWAVYVLPPRHLEAVLAHELAHRLAIPRLPSLLLYWLAYQRIAQQTEEIRRLRDQLARAHGDLRVATARTPASQQGQIVGPDDTPEA